MYSLAKCSHMVNYLTNKAFSMARSESKRVQMRWVAAGAIGVMLAGLGMVWAEHVPIPDDLPEQLLGHELFEVENSAAPEVSADTETEYGDCTVSFTQTPGSFGGVWRSGGSADISLDCNRGYGSGASGGGYDGQMLFNPLSRDFDGDAESIIWEQGGVEFCDLQTTSYSRYPGHGPNTLLITINCWWDEEGVEIITLNATRDDRPLEELATEATHAILGVVAQIDVVPYNVTSANATSANVTEPVQRTVFTEVVVVVREDLRGTYNSTLMTLQFEGGTTDDLWIINDKAPAFSFGENVFVMAGQPDENGHYPIVGMSNGKYKIFENGSAESGDYERFTTVDELRALFEYEPADVG